MKKYDVVLLDIDGTLMDFEKAQDIAFERLMEKHDIPYSLEVYDTYKKINKSLWDALERGEIKKELLKTERFRLFLEALDVEREVLTVTKDYEEALGMGAYLFEGAAEVCEYLSQHCRLAVVTNGITNIQNNRLEKAQIKQHFEKVFISEEIGHNKPDLKFFEKVFEQFPGIPASRMLIVGDSLSADIKGGNTAGIATCWYNPSGNVAGDEFEITHEIKKLEELKQIIEL